MYKYYILKSTVHVKILNLPSAKQKKILCYSAKRLRGKIISCHFLSSPNPHKGRTVDSLLPEKTQHI